MRLVATVLSQPAARGFPWWATIPDNQWLSMARAWHFFFAWVLLINGVVYVFYSGASRHLARDLAPDRSDWRTFGQSIRDHLRFRHPRGEAAKRYNVLQKLAYLIVIFVVLPLVILTEAGGGLCVLLGLFTRFAAIALAGFSSRSCLLASR